MWEPRWRSFVGTGIGSRISRSRGGKGTLPVFSPRARGSQYCVVPMLRGVWLTTIRSFLHIGLGKPLSSARVSSKCPIPYDEVNCPSGHGQRLIPVLSGQDIEAIQFFVGLSVQCCLYCADFAAHLACRWNAQPKIVVAQPEALVPGVVS